MLKSCSVHRLCLRCPVFELNRNLSSFMNGTIFKEKPALNMKHAVGCPDNSLKRTLLRHVQLFSFSPRRQFSAKRSSDGDNAAEIEIDDDLLSDAKYMEMFTESYLRPMQGHRVYVIQPNDKTVSNKMKLTTAELQLSEVCALVETLPKWSVVDKAIYSSKVNDKKHVFGKGNFEEIGKRIRSKPGVTAAVVGVDMLSGLQLATLQDQWGVAIYDRYTLVLQIFQTHAKTKEAKLQVALAEIPYYRSRLHGMHKGTLDQQKGGMKYVGGSGETLMETRQRLLSDREVKLRREITKLRSHRQLIRKQRKKLDFPVISVVGYTNAGKTSLIKALTGEASMEPRDQLFATLDVTAHAGLLPNRMKVIYIDTVGFISDIPTSLIESFSATLEDIANSDVLVHVRDVSHPDTLAQRANVIQTLANLNLPLDLIGAMIEVSNKTDLLPDSARAKLVSSEDHLLISIKEGWGLKDLESRIQSTLMSRTGRLTKHLRIPMNGPHLGWLYKQATIESTRPDETDPENLLVDVVMTDAVYAKFLAEFRQKNLT